MPSESVVLHKDPIVQADHYTLRFSIPWVDLEEIKSVEELHGYIISKVEALMAKGST